MQGKPWVTRTWLKLRVTILWTLMEPLVKGLGTFCTQNTMSTDLHETATGAECF